MANTKISALTAATTPLAGTEVLPIVQSSTTKQVSVADLTAGRSVSAASLSLTTTPLAATSGGTGQSSYAVGDLLYASTTTALSKLADVATGNALISGGVGVAPSWGKIGLTTHVSGTLPTANGGTNLTSFTANGVMYASSASVLATGSNLLFDGTTLNVGLSEFVGRLAATSGYAKTDTAERRTLSLRSTEALASNPLELYFALRGNATASSQMGVIQTGHYGSDFAAPLALNPNYSASNSVLIGTFTIPSSWGISVGVVGTVGQVLGGMQNTNWRIREKSAVDWCAWTTNQNDAGTQDDATKSSWMTQQGFGNGNDYWRIARAPAGSSSFTELVKVDNAGNATIAGTIKSASTISVGGATPATTGAGVTFPATASRSSNANTLDDYEIGTFTPILTDGTNNATSYYYQWANYTKIGNRVFFDITISINNKGSITGDIWVKGLPFTSSSSGYPDNYTYFATACKIFNTGARDEMAAQVEPNNTIVSLLRVTGNGQASVTGAQVTGGSQIFLCGHYFTAS